MNKEKFKGIVIGFILCTFLSSTIILPNASGIMKEIHYGIKVAINSIEEEFPEDMRPFTMDGRTFLPLRAISELLGLSVDYDPETHTAFVGDRPTAQAPTPPTSETNISTPTTNLNLPLIVTETTFSPSNVGARYGSTGIMTGGDLQYIIGGQTIDTNVRSFARNVELYPQLYLYIKTDNTLWGVGSNSNGVLGDGTGVNRDKPVHILDDVAAVYSNGDFSCALKIDGTLWTWGGGVFSPVQIANDVVNVISAVGREIIIQAKTGIIYAVQHREMLSSDLLSEPILTQVLPMAVLGVSSTYFPNYYINAEHTLIKRHYTTSGWNTVLDYEERITTGVKSIFQRELNTFILKLDGTLWGIGQNANGELGDGTKVPRDELVKIADDVTYADTYVFLKQNGTLWFWDGNNPTPKQVLENVAFVTGHYTGQAIHFHDGKLIEISAYRGRSELLRNLESRSLPYFKEYDNVKIPRTITFE